MSLKKGTNFNKSMSFKRSIVIWLGVFLVISISILALSKFGFTGHTTPVAGSDDYIPSNVTNPEDVKNSVYGDNTDEGTSLMTPEELKNIKGLTKGQRYPKQLLSEHSKNVLFVGEDKVSGLYDTIGILSIDKENKKMKIVMIPRDLYVDYNAKVKYFLNLKEEGFKERKLHVNMAEFYKINSAYSIGSYMKYKGKFDVSSMSFLSDLIGEIFDITIDDYIKVNTEGFVQMVDLFGGVDIDVPYAMNYDDPYQDLSIHLKEGMQHLDGKEAEGFVRCRYTYGSNGKLINHGDFERKKNQINFMKAFIQQNGTITNIDKLPKFINTFNKNVKHSIGVGDILTSYIGLAKNAVIDKYEIESLTVTGKDKIINKTYFVDISEEE